MCIQNCLRTMRGHTQEGLPLKDDTPDYSNDLPTRVSAEEGPVVLWRSSRGDQPRATNHEGFEDFNGLEREGNRDDNNLGDRHK